MLEGPIGAAAFNNEFGRPALGGYFRTLEIDGARVGAEEAPGAGDGARARVYGYHKPVMIAGGVGNIRADQIRKTAFAPGARLPRARRPGDAHRPRRRRRILEPVGER